VQVRMAEGKKVGALTHLASSSRSLPSPFSYSVHRVAETSWKNALFGRVAAGFEASKKNSIFRFFALDGVRIRNRIQNSR